MCCFALFVRFRTLLVCWGASVCLFWLSVYFRGVVFVWITLVYATMVCEFGEYFWFVWVLLCSLCGCLFSSLLWSNVYRARLWMLTLLVYCMGYLRRFYCDYFRFVCGYCGVWWVLCV